MRLSIIALASIISFFLANSNVIQSAEQINHADTQPVQLTDWYQSPIDLSFLNRGEIPAGKHGFLQAAGEDLEFEDGTKVRFWGTNITAYAIFGTPEEEVKKQAKRLSKLGFNMVRFHHHDSPWVNPNIFGNQNQDNTLKLDEDMLAKLDWWIKCLKEEGIYTWLDLHAQRHFKKGDGITAFNEISKGKSTASLKGYNYVNPSIQQAMKRFNASYVTHVNAFTDVAYKDEPAIAIMMLTNENDVTHHFGNALLPDKNVPWHNRIYMKEAKQFAKKNKLDSDQVWRSWEQGPSKLFLNDLEYRFNKKMISHLRGLGVKIPIITTSTWGRHPLSSLPALSAGDVIDVHSYGGSGELKKNPLHSANMMQWMASAQVAGKPLTVSEWNVSPFPVADRHNVPIYIASVASHQGWDAVLQYAYAQQPIIGPGKPSNWQSYNDPALLSTLPAAALLYRQGHVSEALTTYALALDQKSFFNQVISPATSVALRTAAIKGKLIISLPQVGALPWLKKHPVPESAMIINNPNKALLSKAANGAETDTGELKWKWAQGIFIIDTQQTQGVIGETGGRSIVLSNVKVESVSEDCVVVVQSLDGHPISLSHDLSITVATGALPEKNEPGKFHVKVSLSGVEGLAVSNGRGIHPPTVSRVQGRYILDLTEHNVIYQLKGSTI